MPTIEPALAAIRRGEYDAALTEFKVLETSPSLEADVRGHRGYLFLSLGRLEEARADYQRLLELNPNDKMASAQLARTLIELGETAAGLELLAKFLQTEPMNDVVRSALARAASISQPVELPT